MHYEWSDGFSLNIKEIDEQHRYFLGILSDLYENTRLKKDKETIRKTALLLSEYAMEHFRTEEGYFKKFHFEGTEEHIVEHRKMMHQINEFNRRSEAVTKNEDLYLLVNDLLDFMEDWLVHHLNEMDRKFVKCFHENGLL